MLTNKGLNQKELRVKNNQSIKEGILLLLEKSSCWDHYSEIY